MATKETKDKDVTPPAPEGAEGSIFFSPAAVNGDMDDVLLALRSSSKVLYVVTNEEDRFLRELHSIIWDQNHQFNEARNNELWIWSAGNGLREITNHAAYMPYNIKYDAKNGVKKVIDQYFPKYSSAEEQTMKETIMATPALNYITAKLTQPPASSQSILDETGKVKNLPKVTYRTFILADYHKIAHQDITSVRKIKDICYDMNVMKFVKMNFIIVSNTLDIPPELAPLVEVFDYSLPSRNHIESMVRKFVKNLTMKKKGKTGTDEELQTEYTDEEVKSLVDSCLGLTSYEIGIQLTKSRHKLLKLDPHYVIKAKEQIVRKSDILQYVHPDIDMKSVGGMEQLKQWFVDRQGAFSVEARNFGLEPPKGVLLLGIPGTGKSMAAKALATVWNVPLLHLDVGKIMSGIVGSSEARMRQALKTAEAVAPCILWVDEIEKGLSGTGSSNFSDGGTLARVFGTFLTWMQEKKSDVFVVATANNISQLPPELLRKGRFDEIFFIDLPGHEERKRIFQIHINKRKQDVEANKIDLEMLSSESNTFSGAEIENVVNDAMYMAFVSKDKKLTTKLILEEIKKTVPLAESMKEELKRVKELAARMRFASDESLNADMNTRKKGAAKIAKAKPQSSLHELVDEPGEE